MRNTSTLAVTFLVLVALVIGCGGSSDNYDYRPLKSSTVTPTPSPSPSPKAKTSDNRKGRKTKARQFTNSLTSPVTEEESSATSDPERSTRRTSRSPAKEKPVNPSGATAMCRDGTLSYSRSRRGTCSHHGGVAVWY